MKKLYSLIAAFPAVAVALLPQLFCPACWPAYASILSSLGIGFINYSPFLLPLTIIFIGAALAGIFYKANSRRGYLPFILALVAATGILGSKFVFEETIYLYSSTILLLAASVWNVWPKKSAACPT